MATTPTSKSQTRTMALFGLECDGSYDMAARVLENAGLPSDGVPAAHTWRTMGKLSDVELLAALPAPTLNSNYVETSKEAHPARPSWYQEAKARRGQQFETESDREFADEVRMARTPFGMAD